MVEQSSLPDHDWHGVTPQVTDIAIAKGVLPFAMARMYIVPKGECPFFFRLSSLALP